MNEITITMPEQDVTRHVPHIHIDLDAGEMVCGPCRFKISATLATELTKCIDAELPKDPKYKSHNIEISTSP